MSEFEFFQSPSLEGPPGFLGRLGYIHNIPKETINIEKQTVLSKECNKIIRFYYFAASLQKRVQKLTHFTPKGKCLQILGDLNDLNALLILNHLCASEFAVFPVDLYSITNYAYSCRTLTKIWGTQNKLDSKCYFISTNLLQSVTMIFKLDIQDCS